MEMSEDDFRRDAKDPLVWKTYGCRLSYSADAIMLVVRAGDALTTNLPLDVKIEGRLHVAQMLYGLALEAGLKARLLEQSTDNVEFKGDPPEMKWKGGHLHDLRKLADATDFLSHHRQEHIPALLVFLTECITWTARYPVPRKLKVEGGKAETACFAFTPGKVFGNIDQLVTPMLEDLLYDQQNRPVWKRKGG